uniref:Molybdopterin synthase sulfur carrier subunit n=1 Tax=Wollemia nobilis TaxID=56998 RepID=A0A0C9RR59_9CONI
MDREMREGDVESMELAKDTYEQKYDVKVKVLFFARARELVGVSEKVLVMEEGSTTLDCVNKLLLQVPSLKEINDCMALALNEMYTTGSTIVKEGDELALIPPISGG